VKSRFQVLLAGAGVVGLTLAALLARSAHRDRFGLTIVDAAPEPQFTDAKDIGLRVSAISTGTAAILADAGAWQSVMDNRVSAYTQMRVWDQHNSVEGPDTLHFSAAEFGIRQLGFIVENQLIQHALLGSLAALKQCVEFQTAILSATRVADRFQVDLSDGRRIAADLLIGADGGTSFVRQQAGIPIDGWRYPQSAFVTHLRPQKTHQATAWQRFLDCGPVALLPLADGRVSIVWSTSPQLAQAAIEMTDDALAVQLTEVTDQVLGRLSAEGPRGAFPLLAQHARHYVEPGLALVGDAAHRVHPLAGQGANLGVADAQCLALVLTKAMQDNEVIGDFRVLRRYERARRGANQTMLQFTDGIHRLFAAKSPPLVALRSTGMGLFNRSGPLREHAVRVALGLNSR